ncbi:hypothetical protein VCV18_013015 [Metarhizium anisopliae]
MKPQDIINRPGYALSVINQICGVSGVPGTTIGVLTEDQAIYTTHVGHGDFSIAFQGILGAPRRLPESVATGCDQ